MFIKADWIIAASLFGLGEESLDTNPDSFGIVGNG